MEKAKKEISDILHRALAGYKDDYKIKEPDGSIYVAWGSVEKDLHAIIKEIRQAVADYMDSEGCSCCRDIDEHKVNRKRLAELLGVSEHPEQDDYYDFSPYSSAPQKGD